MTLPGVTIYEHRSISIGDNPKNGEVDEDTFEALVGFVGGLVNAADEAETRGDKDAEDKPRDVLRISNGPSLVARNYVGIVTVGQTTIEILPKLAVSDLGDEKSREIFLHMLSCLRDTPFKHLGKATLETRHMPILEVFISSFVDEVSEVLRRGVCSDYIEWRGNERFLKGRLDFPEHIRLNHSNKTRFAVEYSLYHVDRPENRLIKSTLVLLLRKSGWAENRRRIRLALDFFDEVSLSTNVRADIAGCRINRNNAYYETALAWCRLFLAGESFAPALGHISADALLFPMERVFEDYVASELRRACRDKGLSISTQDGGRHLFDGPYPSYPLRPDIVIESKRGELSGRQAILDTKWKLHDKPAKSDMYQMFAYGMKYENAEDVILVYPARSKGESGWGENRYASSVGGNSSDGKTICVRSFYYDLLAKMTRGGDPASELVEGVFSV